MKRIEYLTSKQQLQKGKKYSTYHFQIKSNTYFFLSSLKTDFCYQEDTYSDRSQFCTWVLHCQKYFCTFPIRPRQRKNVILYSTNPLSKLLYFSQLDFVQRYLMYFSDRPSRWSWASMQFCTQPNYRDHRKENIGPGPALQSRNNDDQEEGGVNWGFNNLQQ